MQRIGRLLVGAGLLSACATAGSVGGPLTLRARFTVGETRRYQGEVSIDERSADGSHAARVTVRIDEVVEVGGAPDGGEATLAVRFVGTRTNPDGASPHLVALLDGARAELRVGPRGAATLTLAGSHDASDEELLRALLLRPRFTSLPEAPVAPDDRWTEEQTHRGPRTIHLRATHTVEQQVACPAPAIGRCLRVRSETDLSSDDGLREHGQRATLLDERGDAVEVTGSTDTSDGGERSRWDFRLRRSDAPR